MKMIYIVLANALMTAAVLGTAWAIHAGIEYDRAWHQPWYQTLASSFGLVVLFLGPVAGVVELVKKRK